MCASLGIVSGMGDGSFQPDSDITREQAAKMLYNLLSLENIPDYVTMPHVFSDGKDIHSWARDEVYAVYHLGVMLGTDSENFTPAGNYTVEQAICTFVRTYNTYFQANISYEYYPDEQTAEYLRFSKNECRINGDYLWNGADGFDYEPGYFDNAGNTFTAKEKGFVYPFNRDYIVVDTARAIGLTGFIDKTGQLLSPVSDEKTSYSVTENGAVIQLSKEKYYYDPRTGITGDRVWEKESIGCGVYAVENNGKCYYVNEYGSRIAQEDYMVVEQRFLNQYCILQKDSQSFIIVSAAGNVIKSFNLDAKYDVLSICGTNMLLYDKNKEKEVIYKAYSEKTIDDYSYIKFFNNGCISAQKNGKIYLLDNNLEVLFCVTEKGYDEISLIENTDFYIMNKIDKSNWSKTLPYIIADSEGNEILNGIIDGNIILDESGIIACKTGDKQITLIDCFGEKIGVVNTQGNISEFRFINGLVFVKSENDDKQNSYYTPKGERVEL